MIAGLFVIASAWTLELMVVIPPSGAATPREEAEVVVTGDRIRHLKLDVRADRKTGARTCLIKRASGDTALDAAVCAGATDCAQPGGRRSDLEACVNTKLDVIMRARYPGRMFAPLRESDRRR